MSAVPMQHINARTKRRTPPKRRELPPGTIELSLFAPTITHASVMGDFSDWGDRKMTKYADGTWRLTFNVPDGDYEYKFRVRTKSWFYKPGQWVTITDPMATRISSENGNGILRVRGGRAVVDEYRWRHDHVLLPPNNQLIIYELHVADFTGGEEDPHERGQFKHVTTRLDYLADLGVNCLELLPIKEFPGDYSWGYTPQYLFAPESAYGPTEDLKRLIDEAHARGMRVILDGVYNHGHTDHPLAQIDHDYWFHHQPKDINQSWGPQYNYEHYDADFDVWPARKFITENIAYWVREYHIDGIRYDAAKQIDNWDSLRMMRETAVTAAGNKAFINVAEHLPEDPNLCGPLESGRPMDAVWHDTFFWRIANDAIAHGQVDLGAIKACLNPLARGFADCAQVVNYVSNHDHHRLLPHMAKAQGVFDDAAFARAKLAGTVLLTAVGIPMIFMGEEFGEYKEKTHHAAKIDWSLLKNQRNQELLTHYKKLVALRKSVTALQQNHLEFFHENTAANVLAYRRSAEGRDVVVVANFGGGHHDHYHISGWPGDGQWLDVLAASTFGVGGGGAVLQLAPHQARVFVRPG